MSAAGPAAVLTAALARRGEAVFRVRGGSMWPLVPDGSLVRVRRGGGVSTLSPGQLVVRATLDGNVQVHRVVAGARGALHTRGDALDADDGPLTDGALVGVVVAFAPPALPWLPLDGALARALGRAAGDGVAPLLRGLRRRLAAATRRLRATREGGGEGV